MTISETATTVVLFLRMLPDVVAELGVIGVASSLMWFAMSASSGLIALYVALGIIGLLVAVVLLGLWHLHREVLTHD